MPAEPPVAGHRAVDTVEADADLRSHDRSSLIFNLVGSVVQRERGFHEAGVSENMVNRVLSCVLVDSHLLREKIACHGVGTLRWIPKRFGASVEVQPGTLGPQVKRSKSGCVLLREAIKYQPYALGYESRLLEKRLGQTIFRFAEAPGGSDGTIELISQGWLDWQEILHIEKLASAYSHMDLTAEDLFVLGSFRSKTMAYHMVAVGLLSWLEETNRMAEAVRNGDLRQVTSVMKTHDSVLAVVKRSDDLLSSVLVRQEKLRALCKGNITRHYVAPIDDALLVNRISDSSWREVVSIAKDFERATTVLEAVVERLPGALTQGHQAGLGRVRDCLLQMKVPDVPPVVTALESGRLVDCIDRVAKWAVARLQEAGLGLTSAAFYRNFLANAYFLPTKGFRFGY